MGSRVVPGTGLTRARSSPSSALSSDDLPTFGRPMMASRSAFSSAGGSSSGGGSASSTLSRKAPTTIPGAAQELRDLAVHGREALPDVEQQDDDLRLVDRDPGLRLDGRLGRIFRTVEVKPGGVDHRELAAAPVCDAIQPVARQAGLRVDDGFPPAQDAVEQGRLAHVGPADDGDDGARHGSIRPVLP